jgi:hypothetical protein
MLPANSTIFYMIYSCEKCEETVILKSGGFLCGFAPLLELLIVAILRRGEKFSL